MSCPDGQGAFWRLSRGLRQGDRHDGAVSVPAARDLRPLFDPRSIAVVGASNDPAKWGHWLARGALAGEHRRAVYLVNRSGGDVLGRPAYRSLADLPAAAELVAVGVPAAAFEESVDGSLAVGARAIVAISAGLGESGEEGRAREQAVVERIRAAGAVLLGPNCNGVFDAAAELQLGLDGLAAGPIGLISQSGNLCYEIALLAQEIGLGVSRVASVGNQADLEAADLIAAYDADPNTLVIAAYVEDFRDGRGVRAGGPSLADPGRASRRRAQRCREARCALPHGCARQRRPRGRRCLQSGGNRAGRDTSRARRRRPAPPLTAPTARQASRCRRGRRRDGRDRRRRRR